MAEEQPEEQAAKAPAAIFPAPPYFWESFTPENISKVAELRNEQSFQIDDTNTSSHTLQTSQTLRMLDLPSELRFLQPPEPPADGLYRCFGDSYDVYLTLDTEDPRLTLSS